MVKVTWLSANELGYETLNEALSINDSELEINSIITLNQNAKTVMYDGIPQKKWDKIGIPVYKINRIEGDGRKILEKLSPDLVAMIGWRQVIPKEMLNIPKYGFIGMHPTLLPYGRGPAPIINQILAGVIGSGITLFHIKEELDSGDIIDQYKFSIEDEDHAEDLLKKCIEGGKELVKKNLPQIIRGASKRKPQIEELAVIFQRPKDMNLIKRIDSLEEKFRKIKAMSRPYKGAYIEDNNGNSVTVWRAKRASERPEGILYDKIEDLECLALDPIKLYFTDWIEYVKVTEAEFSKNEEKNISNSPTPRR